jgi:hypothetical protein
MPCAHTYTKTMISFLAEITEEEEEEEEAGKDEGNANVSAAEEADVSLESSQPKPLDLEYGKTVVGKF